MRDPLVTRFADFYRALDCEGRGALRRLPELYDPAVTFADPIQRAAGIDELHALFLRLYAQYERVHFPSIDFVGDGDRFMATWTMILRPRIGPPFTVRGASDFVARDGLVVQQIEYWDLLTSVAEIFPGARTMYAFIARHLFT